MGLIPAIEEQVPLHGRTKIDPLAGKVAIEINVFGTFGNEAKKYSGYRIKVEQKGWIYLYVIGREIHKPSHDVMQSTFGKERAFFLDTPGDWERLVKEVLKNY